MGSPWRTNLSLVYPIFDWSFEAYWETTATCWNHENTLTHNLFSYSISLADIYSNYNCLRYSKTPNFLGKDCHLPAAVLPTPILIRYDRAVVLSTWKWTALRENILLKVNGVRIITLSSDRFINLILEDSIDPLWIFYGNILPNLSVKHLFEL